MEHSISLSHFELPSHLPPSASFALRSLCKLKHGNLSLRTPEGHLLQFGHKDQNPKATIEILDWNVCTRALQSGDIGFAESYIAGEWNTDDITALIGVLLENRKIIESFIYGNFFGNLWNRTKHWLNRNTKSQAKKNIHAHYDLGNSFYALWLDSSMTYSSALFDGNNALSLQEAQVAKYQAILNFLEIDHKPHILEIGCGWGGFAEQACFSGAQVTGLTLSKEQLAFAKNRLNILGYESSSEFLLLDYRDAKGQYDAIASIEMFEAVGEEFWNDYFQALQRLLKPNGRAAIQTITIDCTLFERYRRGTDFIQQFIFPGGMLPSATKFRELSEKHGFEIVLEKSFGMDYAETLRRWRLQFMRQLDAVTQQGFDQYFIKTWEFYLAYCEASFTHGSTDVMHFYLQKKRNTTNEH